MPTHAATSQIPILSAGVDWLTMTSRTLAEEVELLRQGERWAEYEREYGNDTRQLSIQGYRGIACGGAFVGTRDDGAMLRLSGEVAKLGWREALASGCVITRLDVEVTAGGGEWCTDLALVHREEARMAVRQRGRPFIVRLDHTDKRGQTLYLGGRQSEVYERCYDKHAEEPRVYPAGSWRYEVELKGTRAGATARAIYDEARPLAATTALVHREFERRGVHPIFAPTGEVGNIRPHRSESSTERRQRWLSEHVGITFARVARDEGLDTALELITRAYRAAEFGKTNTAP